MVMKMWISQTTDICFDLKKDTALLEAFMSSVDLKEWKSDTCSNMVMYTKKDKWIVTKGNDDE